MTIDPNAIARRAVACRRWRWAPGMLALPSGYRVRVVQYEPGAIAGTGVRMLTTGGWASALVQCDDLPDLSDPATLGCLLALVREAWGDPRLVAIYAEAWNLGQSEGWAVQCTDTRLPVAGEDYPSEAEALVAALEAAP